MERPESRFFNEGFKSAKENLKQRVTPTLGGDLTIAEVNGSSVYARELESLSTDNQQRRHSGLHSSVYRVVDKWRHAIGQFFCEHHSFTSQSGAFANHNSRRFKKFFVDTWARKWDKRLQISTPFHIIQQVNSSRTRHRRF